MPTNTSTLLMRNLNDVFGEIDPARRRAAINDIYNEECALYEPGGVHRGCDEIDSVAGAVMTAFPEHRYQILAEPEELGDGVGA